MKFSRTSNHHCHHHLVTSLYISIQAVQLLPVLTNHSTDHISNGHHAQHPLSIYDWNMPDTVICHPTMSSKLKLQRIKREEKKERITINNEKQHIIPVISCIARKTLVSGVTVISLFCSHRVIAHAIVRNNTGNVNNLLQTIDIKQE